MSQDPSQTNATMDDVARKSGVSTATVSRVLNMPDQVAEKTRRKVITVMDQLGYTPNFGARALAAKRTQTIGAIIPTMENAVFAKGLQAFQHKLHEMGFTLLVASSGYDPKGEEDLIRTMVARGADALLLIGQARSTAIYEFLERANIPYLISWYADPSFPGPSVGFNNRLAMKEMANRALELGHKKFGYLSAHTTSNDRARDRVEGAKDALLEAGLGVSDLQIVETDPTIDCGRQGFKTLMASQKRPTIILCGNDVLAIGAMTEARITGISVPNAVSITGFDDIELAKTAIPELTTVNVPHQLMGEKAAETLVNTLRGHAPTDQELLETEIRLRKSLGPPNGIGSV